MKRRTTSHTGKSAARGRNVRAGRIRIIGGSLRGRYIDVPAGAALRPTPNRVRETLFNWLQHDVAGSHCLDLYAGSGALGIEALSRGAAAVTFVEADAGIAAALRGQLAQLNVTGNVVCRSVEAFLADSSDAFDIIFADPPFADAAEPVCEAVPARLRADGVFYCERDAAGELPALSWAPWSRSQQAGDVRFGIARMPADD